MIGAALVDPIIALVRDAAPDLRYVGPANDLAALIAARRLPERVPAAYVLPTAEAAEQAQRTVHRTLVTTIMTVVLVASESRRGPDDRPLDTLGAAVIAALDGVLPAPDWRVLGYRGGDQQVRAASSDRDGGVFLTLHFETTTQRQRS
ncbi:hypothetical protein F1188_04360 [Roseospira marina]|uniref:DUF3168 domain-containing protein n=1 Tax=Roseospira marina TaxID=140057 RepID=A0A5M6IFS1_9PROT|nr:hypothetical protein [Roseospira marina]KAA5607140.1 hypothetical protein F1188_04360 [Roseospira marina]MBB4312661.1 hypothetical protein [Roseospira marina]MBB5086566.1 hypothetical protein [Roseospira marina]